VTQTTSLLKAETKTIFYIGYDDLGPNVASYFLSIPCIHDEEGLLGDNGGISKSMFVLNVMG
jgi:hypothetical protein